MVRVRRAGKAVAAHHRLLRRGRGTIDLPLSRTLRGRYEVMLVLDDGTKAVKAITIR